MARRTSAQLLLLGAGLGAACAANTLREPWHLLTEGRKNVARVQIAERFYSVPDPCLCERLRGGVGEERLTGGADEGRLTGEVDEDRLSGGADEGRLTGGADEGRLTGGADEDRLSGGADEDRLSGGADEDRMLGEETEKIYCGATLDCTVVRLRDGRTLPLVTSP